jgi:hypothetical protein
MRNTKQETILGGRSKATLARGWRRRFGAVCLELCAPRKAP